MSEMIFETRTFLESMNEYHFASRSLAVRFQSILNFEKISEFYRSVRKTWFVSLIKNLQLKAAAEM